MRQDVYFGFLRLYGEEDSSTISEAFNYANTLVDLERFEEGRSLMHKVIPMARRVFGETYELTLRMRWVYARSLYGDAATLADFREVFTTFEDLERTARRVLGNLHPIARGIETALRGARAALRARETPPGAA